MEHHRLLPLVDPSIHLLKIQTLTALLNKTPASSSVSPYGNSRNQPTS
ncbi:14724_t:CDS:2 [Acaulospora morrowiae]|uniref:14724_t:CDS:1 n=1 Tax=Acaulospora morrowiae TaxID=94023 RepID=A0A9N8V4Q8_9GLOM|nr:14724_t:CDS:2 [Acaulospora morrowiae]